MAGDNLLNPKILDDLAEAQKSMREQLNLAPAQATREQLVAALESEEFYSLMQAYRFAPLAHQSAVTRSFEAVKQFIRERLLGGK